MPSTSPAGVLLLTLLLCASAGSQTDTWTNHRVEGDRLRDAGRFGEARDAYAAALEAAEQLGPDGPGVAAILNSLALLHFMQREYGPAEQYYRHSLDILRRRFGSAHPEVLTVSSNLAELYRVSNQPEKAAALYDEWFATAALARISHTGSSKKPPTLA